MAQGRFFSDIPAPEASALAQVVEDDPPPATPQRKGGESPALTLYQKVLPIPPPAEVKQKVTNPVTGKEIWYYELEIKPFTQQVYPNLQPARLVGYNGTSPGPTIIVPRGQETVVRFVNNGDRQSSIHLHGSPSRAPFDGWAADETFPGQYKDYYYPNYQSGRLLWYHDHALGWTAENAYYGQAGAYLITDPAEDALGLPSGYGKYDIPLILTCKFYNKDGTLKTSQGEETSLWGDVIHVNGQPWPFFNVEPRKYRFRILDSAISRNFDLFFVKSTATSTRLPFQVIASDSGLLERPVQVTDLKNAVAERYEIVFDFSQYAGQSIELRNDQDAGGIGVDDKFDNTDKVMKFVVSGTQVTDTSKVPTALRTVPFPPASSGIDHHFRFHRTNSEWRINGVGFEDAANRVLASVPRGKVEIWELENSSGGWTHPIHVHLVDFRVISRNGRGVEPYESAGLKDVVWLGRNEVVKVEAHYAPWSGVYMFHCHNLIHEDHDMMAAFNVTQLQQLGYNETTDFSDPEDPRWSAKPFIQDNLRARSGPFTAKSINDRIQEIAREQPYSELAEVEAALEAAWADGTAQKRGTEDYQKTGPIPRYRRFVV
ncbi:phenol oxidase A [Massarina eburnea CBS 473.64]|uniref:Phenol oxidase A n=1 Tax=Massarina eburnea CBS 473.64 TaxID=1395130 RepID=A0A6A6SDE3_9PLEO|nr:phenol oxidase A [Massarina eburnea CBS 473.64]